MTSTTRALNFCAFLLAGLGMFACKPPNPLAPGDDDDLPQYFPSSGAYMASSGVTSTTSGVANSSGGAGSSGTLASSGVVVSSSSGTPSSGDLASSGSARSSSSGTVNPSSGNCTPNCGLRMCGQDPVCGQSCGTCQEGVCGTSGRCEYSENGGPSFISLETNLRTMAPDQTLRFSAVLTDPNGVTDLIGGTLRDPGGGTYGAFATAADEGAYSLTLTWQEIQDVRAIFTNPGGTLRIFEAEFFDQGGKKARQQIGVILACKDSQTACNGTCVTGGHVCDDACVSNTDVATCGMSCTPCPSEPNAHPTCDGQCGTECNTGYLRCGSACQPCPNVTNGVTGCEADACVLTACKPGYYRCEAGCCAYPSRSVIYGETQGVRALLVEPNGKIWTAVSNLSANSDWAFVNVRASTNRGQDWTTEMEDGPFLSVGRGSVSMVVDGSGMLHMTGYKYDAGDHYWYNTSTGWKTEPLVNLDEPLLTIASGKLYLAALDGTTSLDPLVFKSRSTTGWKTEPVPDLTDPWDIELTTMGGQPVMSWWKTVDGVVKLHYAEFNGTDWTITPVHPAPGEQGDNEFYDTQLLVDTQGNAHLTFYALSPDGVHHIHQVNGAWEREFIPLERARVVETAVDTSGRVVIAYLKYADNGSSLHLRMGDGSSSVVQESGVFDEKLVVDASNTLHMVYIRMSGSNTSRGYVSYTWR